MQETKRYKLLCVCESMATGIYFFLNSLLNCLCEDYDIVIVYAERYETPKDIRAHFDERIKLIKMETFRRGMDPCMIWASQRELRKIIQEEKPDVIHLNSSMAGIVGRIAAAGSKIPVLYTPHLFSFMQPSFSPAKRLAFRTAEWLLARLGGYIIGVSESEYRAAQKAPKIIHYAGFRKPWHNPTEDFATYFWDALRRTPYYEEMLYRLMETVAATQLYESSQKKSVRYWVVFCIRKVADIVFPLGSVRREKLRKFLGRE